MFIAHPRRLQGRTFIQYRGTVSLGTGPLYGPIRLALAMQGGGGSGGGGTPPGTYGGGLYGERGSPGTVLNTTITFVAYLKYSAKIAPSISAPGHLITVDPDVIGTRARAANGLTGFDSEIVSGSTPIARGSGGIGGQGAAFWDWNSYQTNHEYRKSGNGGWGVYPEYSNASQNANGWRTVNATGGAGVILATWR